MTPPMGLTSWASFKRIGRHTVVMGDMVLLEDQVNPVMSIALDNSLEVTGLHNHFLWDSPRVMFMHLGGMESEEGLAAAVGKVFAKIKETSEAILHRKGDLSSGVYKVVVGRTTRMHNGVMGNTIKINT